MADIEIETPRHFPECQGCARVGQMGQEFLGFINHLQRDVQITAFAIKCEVKPPVPGSANPQVQMRGILVFDSEARLESGPHVVRCPHFEPEPLPPDRLELAIALVRRAHLAGQVFPNESSHNRVR
jgi:hypothetical protein